MQVIVNKKELDKAINKIINEKSTHSARIDTIAGDSTVPEQDDESPISATDVMSNPSVVDRPPVDHEDFVPKSIKELSMSAAVISEEVPESQIEFFYRKLHKLLDISLDKEEELNGESAMSESFKNVLSLVVEQVIDDDEDDDEDFEVSDEDEDRILSGISEGVDRLIEDIYQFQIQVTDQWINAGMMSDQRRALEKQYPYIFERPRNITNMVLGILAMPKFAQSVNDIAKSKSLKPESVKMSAIRKYQERFPVRTSEPMSAEQVEVNQALSKELDDLLPVKTYEEIIEIYSNKLANKSLSIESPLLAQGYKDMIDLVKRRIRDPLKRERTDLSAKISKENNPEDVDVETSETQLEKERLKALDALAPYFGFKNASGIRQWRRKYADPKFKALIGSDNGIKAYEGYTSRVFDNMAALLDKFNEIATTTLENISSDIEKSPNDKELVDLKDSFEYIANQIFAMHDESLDSETGMPETESLLNTAAGMMLRIGFSELYFNNQFRDFAKEMKAHMTIFLVSQGLDSGIAKTFSKMFNGEVDLVKLTDDSAQARKLAKGGVTQDVWRNALKESEKFTESFFTGEKQKEYDKKYSQVLDNKKKIIDIFEKSIDMAIDSLDMEERIDQATSDQKDTENLQELKLRKMISRANTLKWIY